MNNNKTLISVIPLIEKWESFVATGQSADIQKFAQWILMQEDDNNGAPGTNDIFGYFDERTAENDFQYKSSEAAFLIWRLAKFIRLYTKPVIIAAGLASQDDFAILAHIDYRKSCSKKEAIEANLIDLSTGIEMIKRLVKSGLISETQNSEDKRQKLITLTDKGREKLYGIYKSFSAIQDIMGDFDAKSREQLFKMLDGLNDFHTRNLK